MKRFFAIILLLMLSLSTAAEQKGSDRVVFDKSSFDFGDVQKENKNYTCSFVVENCTEQPLVLLSVNTSCSCLKAHYSRRPMKAGEKGTIAITLEAGKMDIGVFHRVVEVQTNAGVYRIVVKGNTVPKK